MPETLAVLEEKLEGFNRRGEETTEKVDLLIALIVALRTNQPRRMLALAREACDLSERLDYRSGLGHSLGYMGFAHYMLSEQEAAHVKLKAALLLRPLD